MKPPQLIAYSLKNSWTLATYLEFESEVLTECTLDTFPWNIMPGELAQTCGQERLDRRRINNFEVVPDA